MGRNHRARWSAIGAAVAVSIGAGGLITFASAAGGSSSTFTAITPCRLLDTRSDGPATGATPARTAPLGQGESLTITARGNFGRCVGLSPTATGAVLNVTTVNATAGSFLTVWPAGSERPLASNLNWVAGQAATPNQVTTGLDSSGRLSLYNNTGTVDVIVDIVGVYEPAIGGSGPGIPGAPGAKGDKGDKGDVGDAGGLGADGPEGADGAPGTQLMTSSNPDTPSTESGHYSSMRLDANDNPVISHFSDAELRLTHCGDPACITSVTNSVDPVAGQYSSLQLDSNGLPVISYYDPATTTLKLAHCSDPDCTDQASVATVDSGPNDRGQFSSLALDADIPVISYYDATDQKLVLAHCTDPDCTDPATITEVDTGEGADDVGQFSSLALNGSPIIAYYNATADELKLMYCGDMDCTNVSSVATVDIGAGRDLSMALDNENSPVIAYLVGDGTLRVAHCDPDTECTSPQIGDLQSGLTGPLGTSVAVDAATDSPVISYIDDSLADPAMSVIHCSDPACTEWATSRPDPVPSGTPANTSIVLDVNGIPTISRFDGNIHQLTVTHCINSLCIPHTRVLEPQP